MSSIDIKTTEKSPNPPRTKRKTDRRTLYTNGVIKDAFLELIDQEPYEQVNVTAICRQAEISRATFYAHFDNVEDVLDSVIDDALLFSEHASGNLCDMVSVIRRKGIGPLKEDESILPACQRIADSDRYHRLFMDAAVSDHILQRIASHEKETVVDSLMENSSLSEKDAEMLFRFILHGSFAVNRSLGWEKDARWYHFQELISRFITGGLKEM